MSKKKSRAITDFIALALHEARPHFTAPDAEEMAGMLVTGWLWTKLVDDRGGVVGKEAILRRMQALRN